MKKILFAVFVCQIFLVTCRTPDDDNGNSSSTNIFEANTGSFEFTSHDPLSEKPFKVHFYIPNSVDRCNSQILFTFVKLFSTLIPQLTIAGQMKGNTKEAPSAWT